MGRVRIVAGSLKGRRIDVPDHERVRPTADRVREALFAILAGRVVGARVLDAYSGSGALGFEALSRGAGEVLFVEQHGRAVAALRAAASRFGVAGRCRFLRGRVDRALADGSGEGPFDLILADPPYGGGEVRTVLEVAGRLLADSGLLVLERDRREEPPQGGFEVELERTARYGRSCLDLYRRPV